MGVNSSAVRPPAGRLFLFAKQEGGFAMTDDTPAAYLSVADACRYLGIHRHSFERHVYPHLKSVRFGRTIRISRQELDKWLASQARPMGPVTSK